MMVYMEEVEVVRVQERKVTGGYRIKYVTVPKKIAEAFGIKKGDLLKVYIREMDGKKVLVYEKVE